MEGAFDATRMYLHENNKRAYGAQEVPQGAIEIDLTGDPAAALPLHQTSLAKPQRTLDSDSDDSVELKRQIILEEV